MGRKKERQVQSNGTQHQRQFSKAYYQVGMVMDHGELNPVQIWDPRDGEGVAIRHHVGTEHGEQVLGAVVMPDRQCDRGVLSRNRELSSIVSSRYLTIMKERRPSPSTRNATYPSTQPRIQAFEMPTC